MTVRRSAVSWMSSSTVLTRELPSVAIRNDSGVFSKGRHGAAGPEEPIPRWPVNCGTKRRFSYDRVCDRVCGVTKKKVMQKEATGDANVWKTGRFITPFPVAKSDRQKTAVHGHDEWPDSDTVNVMCASSLNVLGSVKSNQCEGIGSAQFWDGSCMVATASSNLACKSCLCVACA